jgi:tRNA (mo5U34)-methyltransferase
MAVTERNAIASELAELGEWFHNLHLPGGIQTAPQHPLGDFPARKWSVLEGCVPADLSGYRVLDIGCNGGYYSFALAARGADVLGVDIDARYLAQARWASRQLGLANPPAFRELSVYRLLELDEHFDLIWFMGVAYHLRHPLLALDIVRSFSPQYLMFQTMTYPDAAAADVPEDFALTERERMSAPGWPRLGFIEHRLAGDPTNWWAANAAAAEAMLRSSGFRVLARPDPETWWCETAEADPAVRAELGAVMDGRTL